MTTDRTILKEGLPLWMKLRGLDGDTLRTTTLGEWDAMRQSEAISEALTLEPTELTAQMMLGYYLGIYEANTQFVMKDLLFKPEVFNEKAALCREIHAILDRDDLVNDRLLFAGQLDLALQHYGAADRKDIQELLADDNALAILRRDAFKSNKNLAVSQFLKGDAGAHTKRPGYSTVLRQWWNINSLLEAAVRFPEGVSLHMINAPSGFESFFVFLVRRGANLYILHDAPDYAHPLQGDMARKPNRDMDRRASKNWFPYSLMGLDYDEETGEAYIRAANSSALVPTGGAFAGETTVVKHINEMPAAELVWVTLMFDLLMDRFWVQELPALPMSYTGQMLKQEGALLANAASAGLPVVVHERPSVAVPQLSVKDVAAMNRSEDAEAFLGETPEHPYAWMEERYGAQVPDEAFNLVLIESKKSSARLVGHTVEVAEMPDGLGYFEQEAWSKKGLTLKSLSPTHFGTADELKADRAFLARKNYAMAINMAARKEYAKRKDEILAWYHEKMAKRVPFLKGLLGHGKLVVNDLKGDGLWPGFSRQTSGIQSQWWDRQKEAYTGKGYSHELMATLMADEKHYHYRQHAKNLGPSKMTTRYQPLCVHYGTVMAASVVFSPTNASELAFLLGMEVNELPDVLQHFTLMEAGGGNYILDRIDPLAWSLENPWTQMDFNVRLCLSKRGLKKAEQDKQPVDLSGLDGINDRMGRGLPASDTQELPPRGRRAQKRAAQSSEEE